MVDFDGEKSAAVPLIPAFGVCTPPFTSAEESVPSHDSHTMAASNHSGLLIPPSTCLSMPPIMPQPQPNPMSGHGNFGFNMFYPGSPLGSPIPQSYLRAYNTYPVSFTNPGCQFYAPVTQSFGGVHPFYNFSTADTAPSGNGSLPKCFTLQWLTGTQIRMCYGCNSPIRTDVATIPEPPYDIIIRYKERRYYKDKATQSLKLTKQEENTYYHCMKTCILNRHPGFTSNFLYIPPDLIPSLLPSHKQHVYDNFGICL